MAFDPAIAAILGIDSGGDQKGMMEAAKAANLLAQNTPGAPGVNPMTVANGLAVNDVSVVAFEKMMEGSVAAQTIAAEYSSKDQKKKSKLLTSSATEIVSSDHSTSGEKSVSDSLKTSDLYAQNVPTTGSSQTAGTSSSPAINQNDLSSTPVVVSIGTSKEALRRMPTPVSVHGGWPPYVTESPLVNPNNIVRDINNLIEGYGGVENPANVFRAQVLLMQAEVQWNLMSQLAAKGVSGIQTLFSNQI